jgi:hypothetical protein
VSRRLAKAIRQAYAKGYLGEDVMGSGKRFHLTLHRGAAAYICGEETALLDSLEGRRGQPRLRPPFPAVSGLYGCPTTVNNVESIAMAPLLVLNGPEWFTAVGDREVTGHEADVHLRRGEEPPGNYEVALGTTIRELIEMAGGMLDGRELKFFCPGGSSTPMLPASMIDLPYSFEDIAGRRLAAGHRRADALQRPDVGRLRRAPLHRVLRARVVRQVHPVPRGRLLGQPDHARIDTGAGVMEDLQTLEDLCGNIFGRSFCALGDALTSPIVSSLQYFRDEYVEHITKGLSPYGVATAPRRGHVRPADRRRHRALPRGARGGGRMSGTEELVTLTIDGVEVQVPKGTLIIRAAEQLGTIVPRFCDHPLLDPVGACRQCVVEVEGQPKPVMSCTGRGRARHGRAHAPHLRGRASARQEGTLEFLLVNHPLDCPMCDKGGECPAAGPGARARGEHVALPRPEAQVRQAGRRQLPGAARP